MVTLNSLKNVTTLELKTNRAYYINIAQAEAYKEFRDYDKARIAADAVACGIDFLASQPIGWLPDYDEKVLEKKLRKHLKSNFNPKPVGFFAVPIIGWFFWTVVSGIISWAIRRILDWKFPKEK